MASYHWATPDGVVIERDGKRHPIGCVRIRPGGSATIPLVVEAPTEPGRYQLQFRLVQERSRGPTRSAPNWSFRCP